jgi:hypothetical protein
VPDSKQLELELAQMREGDDDPIWTYNAPEFVTGDRCGIWDDAVARESLEKNSPPLAALLSRASQHEQTRKPLTLDDKRENAIAYFSVLIELEERRGVATHFRIILTVGPEASNRELKVMVNAFLKENFPLAQALAAIHRDSSHTHAHIFVHPRQLNQERVNLGQKYFQLDESWMRVCAERLNDPEIYEKHMELKAVTLEWKKRANEARLKGEPIPPKDDRWKDHHETKLRFQPWDDQWCGRLMAQTRVAEKQVEYLQATEAKKKEVAAAAREAEELRARLEDTEKRRRASVRSKTKRVMPAEIITLKEVRALAQYERAIRERSRSANREKAAATETPLFPLGGIEVISEGRGKLTTRQEDERAFGIAKPQRAKASERSNVSAKQLSFELEPQQRPVAPRQTSAPQDISFSAPTPASPLPDEKAWRLIVSLELAKGQAIALRAEEAEFNSKPHCWLSPAEKLCLSQIEGQLITNRKQEKNADDPGKVREKIQQELAIERASLHSQRVEMEARVSELGERLRQEQSARAALNLSQPTGRFTQEELREVISCAESARDSKLLQRVFNIKHDQALRGKEGIEKQEVIYRIAEKYIGVELSADVTLYKSQKSLEGALRSPEQIMFPAKDKEGRDIAVSWEQINPPKGVRGLIKKISETKEGRLARTSLVAAKDKYIECLRAECASKKSFFEAARMIAQECGALCKEYGFVRPPTAGLSPEKLQDIEKYARGQNSPESARWLTLCAQSRVASEQRAEAAKRANLKDMPKESVESQTSPYVVPKEIELQRRQMEKPFLDSVREQVRERESRKTGIDSQQREQTQTKYRGPSR